MLLLASVLAALMLYGRLHVYGTIACKSGESMMKRRTSNTNEEAAPATDEEALVQHR